MIPNELNITTLDNPNALDSIADDVDKDIYKEDIKAYTKENHALTRSVKIFYSLVLDQFTKIMRTKMNPNPNPNPNDKSNSV